jgi:hypothetical protein
MRANKLKNAFYYVVEKINGSISVNYFACSCLAVAAIAIYVIVKSILVIVGC